MLITGLGYCVDIERALRLVRSILLIDQWGAPRLQALSSFGEQSFSERVRYRTVGDASCTAAVKSDADTIEKVIEEVAATRITERGATRGDDKVSEAAMEDRKREGYF